MAKKLAEAFVEISVNNTQLLAGLNRSKESTARATQQMGKMGSQAMAIFRQTRTPLERYRLELGRLRDMLRRGAISQDTFARAAARIRTQLPGASTAIGRTRVALARTSVGMTRATKKSGRLTRSIFELSRGVEDAVIGFGIQGLGGALRASTNNMSQALAVFGPMVGTIGALSAAGLAVMIPFLTAARSKAKALADEMENLSAVLDKVAERAVTRFEIERLETFEEAKSGKKALEAEKVRAEEKVAETKFRRKIARRQLAKRKREVRAEFFESQQQLPISGAQIALRFRRGKRFQVPLEETIARRVKADPESIRIEKKLKVILKERLAAEAKLGEIATDFAAFTAEEFDLRKREGIETFQEIRKDIAGRKRRQLLDDVKGEEQKAKRREAVDKKRTADLDRLSSLEATLVGETDKELGAVMAIENELEKRRRLIEESTLLTRAEKDRLLGLARSGAAAKTRGATKGREGAAAKFGFAGIADLSKKIQQAIQPNKQQQIDQRNEKNTAETAKTSKKIAENTGSILKKIGNQPALAGP